MQNAELSLPTRVVLAVVLGLAVLVVLFGLRLVLLGQTGRLSYSSGMTVFVACCIASTAIAVIGVVGPLRTFVIGTNRNKFFSVATWISVLLPVASIGEWALFSGERYWWCAHAVQFLFAGLLAVAVAVSRRGWWWFLGSSGVLVTALGPLEATGPLWAK